MDTFKDIKDLWKQKTLEETYLASIANCDKRITRDKKLLLKVNNDLSRKMLKGNIAMMEKMREKWSNLLAEHRKELAKEGEPKQ
jgi:hypothetical protein